MELKKSRRIQNLFVCSLVIFVLLCSWIQLQISCIYSSRHEIGEIDIRYIILNILTNYVLLGIIYILVNSLWCSCLLFSILTLCISVVNHYTIELHSSPFTISELGNPAMGFDEIYFEDDFKDIAYYGNRGYATDECLYKNLLSWLEREDEMPQFVYLLTIQNHGGWDLNERDLDTVHAENDFGEYDEEVDEYLSCIRLSDIAFKEFTDRLKDIDRDIIVCMVGDHGPSSTSKMAGDLESNQSWLLRTSVPFVIWANYTLPDEVFTSRGNMIHGMPLRYETENRNDIAGQCISMNYLAPTLLNIAQVELSPYYEYMLELKSKIPVLTPFVVYFDKSGSTYAYDSASEYTDMVNNYLYLEYNNLQKNREQRLFDPYKDLR